MTDRLANHYFDADILLNFFRIHQEKIIIGLINNRFITEQVYKEFLSLCKYRMGAEVGNRLTFLVEDGRYKLVNKNNFSISEYLYYQSLLDPQIGR
ncbi:MAG TPA: hypothetical protein DCX17_00320 [Firmicutes bacterium]|jgi:hypothetical protein|nr:hypothetical protein [Bacillota bacterium]